MPDPDLKTLSATQSAALFDVSPYTTKWLLWRVFSGLDTLDALDEEENERMFWGKIHEPAIFSETLRRLGLEGRYNANQDYVRHPDLPIGCTPDGEVWHPSKGKAVVQVKCVDWMVWKDAWTEDTPPPQIVHQVQHEMLVMGAEWAVIPCLINGNKLLIYEMYPDAEFQEEIKSRAADFFRSVSAGEEPDPLGLEIEKPALLRREVRYGESVDLTGSEAAFDAIQALRHYEPLISAGTKAVKAAKTKLLALSGGATIIRAHGYGAEISFSKTKESSVELPEALAAKLEEMSRGVDDDEREVLELAASWRKVTRKGGVMTKFKTWEAPTEETPPWLEAFDDFALEGG